MARAASEFETLRNWDWKDGQLTAEGVWEGSRALGRMMDGGVQWIGHVSCCFPGHFPRNSIGEHSFKV